MIRNILITNLFLISQYFSLAEYKPLQPSGEIPSVLSIPYFSEGMSATEKYSEQYKFSDVKTGNEFHVSGELSLRNLVISGNVIWGDPVSKALQKEADKISNRGNLSIKPQVFLIRSENVNAYATYGNCIFFTTALVANSSSYYELVYILGHEMAHLVEKDIYTKFLERKYVQQEFRKGPKRATIFNLKKIDRLNELGDNLSKHSKDKELQADHLGHSYFSSLNYPTEYTLSAIKNLEDTKTKPVYNFRFEDSVYTSLPSLIVRKSDVRALKKLRDERSKTHPEFEERYTQLRTLNKRTKDLRRDKADVDFKEMKRICMNETLYAYFLNHHYYKILAYYHLGDHSSCDKEFLQFLYAQSMYTLLKVKLELYKVRSTYEPNKIVVEHNGPLRPLIDIAEPMSFLGPERAFINYFEDFHLSDLWYETVSAILTSHAEASYYSYSLIYDDCLSIYKDLPKDGKSLKSEESILDLKRKLSDTKSAVSHKLGNEKILLLIPYSLYASGTSAVDTDLDLKDQEFRNFISSYSNPLQITKDPLQHITINSTDELNDYNELKNLIFHRYELGFLDSYAFQSPNQPMNVQSIVIAQIEDYGDMSQMILSNNSFLNGEIENDTLINAKFAGDNWKKWTKSLKKLSFLNP